MGLILRSENSASITTPEAGKATLFYDSAENVMKFKDYTGVSYIFGSGSGQSNVPFLKNLTPTAAVTGNTTASYTQQTVVDLASVALTVSGVFIEAPAAAAGATFGVKIKEATNTKFVTITLPAGSTVLFNGVNTTHTLNCDGEFVQFTCDGTNWVQNSHGFDQYWNAPNINPRCNPAAWYTFIGPTNADCYTDRSGNGRHLVSAVSTSTGNSLAYNGIRSDLSASYNTVWSLFSGSSIIGTSSYTVAVLAKRPSATGGLPVFSCPAHAGQTTYPAQLNFGSNTLNWFSNNGTPTNVTLFTINSFGINDTDQWYVYWLTVNSSHNVATTYVNNYLGNAVAISQAVATYPNTAALNFGAWNAPTQAAGLWLRVLSRKEMNYVTRCLLGPAIRG